MRFLKRIIIILLICWLGISIWLLSPYMGCESESASNQSPQSQVATVQRGDLTIDITAAGNLALSHKEDLAFDIFYTEATVEEVLVTAGDTVEEGQVLARLNTSEWQDELRTLEDNVLQTQTNYTNAKVALEQAEWTTNLEMEVRQVAVEQAQQQYWEAVIKYDYGRISEEALLLAQTNLETAQAALATVTTNTVEVKERKLSLAEARLKEAERELAQALDTGPVVSAPFVGFITKVNVEGGDEIKKGTVAVTLADPNKFEAEVLVSEMDISQIKLGGEAWVEVDAIQGISLPAKVTHISPTATIQSGVVNYKVKVEVESLEAVRQAQQEASQKAMEEIASGQLPEHLQQAIEEERITQEQAEEMIKQAQGGQQKSVSTAIPEDVQLREGLNITISIIVDKRSNVLLIPNGAITTQRGQTYAQVLSADGTIEERPITTGISDWQYTEVTEGLSEGEQVIIPKGTTATTTTTTTPQQNKASGIMIPGMRPR